jgi:cytochrome c556
LIRIRTVPFLLAAFAIAAPAFAADDKVHIEYRQKVMSGVGADMGAISDILKHDLPFTANVALHANRLEDAAALIPSAFEKKTADLATDAKPEIWMEPTKFEAAIADFASAADALEDAADDGDPEQIKAAFKMLGRSCGGCHKPFRKPKEESYKQQ